MYHLQSFWLAHRTCGSHFPKPHPVSATPPMRTSASAHDVQTYRLQEILYSKAIVQALEINALLRMDTHPNPLTLSILVWLYMLLTRVLALSIPNPSLNIDPSNANPLNASDIEIPISNLTSLGGIDPAFDFVPHFQGAKLRPVPCLLNSVNAALQLALENFEGPMFATVFRLASHPQVEIGVLPEEEGGSIPRKYAVWGLNVGIGTLIQPSHSYHVCSGSVPSPAAHRIGLVQSALLNLRLLHRHDDNKPQLPNRNYHTLLSRRDSRPYHF